MLHFFFTKGVNEAISENRQFNKDVVKSVKRYCRSDFGDICEEDKKTNEEALKNGDRIVAVYKTCKGKIYIITEADRSATTVLFAEEY